MYLSAGKRLCIRLWCTAAQLKIIEHFTRNVTIKRGKKENMKSRYNAMFLAA